MNGKLAVPAHIDERTAVAKLPGECGQPVRWQVAVRVGSAISNLSAPVHYDLPPCQAYLRVSFNEISLTKTDDGWPGDQCDTLDTYFQISARDVTRSFWNTNFVIPLKCGIHQFSNMTGGVYKQLYAPEPYVITIPVAPGEDLSAFWIKARFWDSDSWSSDDLFASFAEHPSNAYVPKMGEKWTGTNTGFCFDQVYTGYSVSDEARSSLYFSYSVYPNICKDIPPAEGF